MNSTSNNSSPTQSNVKTTKKSVLEAKADRIRTELNIERWPAMWQPSKSKTKAAVRTMEREVTFPDGSRGISKLEVGFTQFGTVTTEDQRMFYALIKQWEDSGKPEAHVFFSDRLLARLLKKTWGTNVIDALTGALRRLRLTPFRWIKSYHRSDTPGKEVEEEIPFTILSDLKIIKRKSDGHVTNQQGYFQFDRNLLENLQTNYTKPLLLEEFFKLKSEIGQLIYTHVDLIMSDKTRYERRSKDLFCDLGLGELVFYKHASHRKQALDRALKDLRGISLSTGVLKSAALEKTKDGKDYKVVFQKGARSAVDGRLDLAAEISATAGAAKDEIVINDYSKKKEPAIAPAEELVRYFHKIIHGIEQRYPQPKEIGQALSLIARHGEEKAKFVVEYAAAKAVETNFKIQHFGAILSYTSRALAVFDRQQAVDVATMPAESRPIHQERRTWKRGEARLAVLSPEQYEARCEGCKNDLFREHPLVVQYLRAGSKLYESTIRARLVQELESESMDLVTFDSTLTAKYPWYPLAQNLPLLAPENSEPVISSC